MDVLISIIVPVYNVENYLVKCLESIVSQTYKNLEILLIDDGSKDSSGKICDAFARKDARIKVIHKQNEGVSAARNLGKDICAGEYIMFVDADDYMSANAVECLLGRMKKDECDMVIGRHMLVYEGETRADAYHILKKDLTLTKEQALSCLGTESKLPRGPWAKLYSKTALSNISFPSIRYGEDDWIFPHILDNCKKIAIVSDVIYYYVQRQDSAVHMIEDGKMLESISAMLHIAEFLEEHQRKENALAYYKEAIHRAMRMKDKKKARELIVHKINPVTRRKLLYKDIRLQFRWVSLYFPFVYTSVKWFQRVMLGK